ncbi:probable myosin-binding protein 5 [Rhodamnia argentea]|uniref:Probable myosin-binding protein 5 n=1 Tax=Rhodamnia argentea TaxID=178133 RepID=A0A8B8P8U9_9MYRT|nr:probable myosin-binding protein 5 [Rhodamnia argentea]
MAGRSFKCFVEQELGKFPLLAIYAVLEWLLIVILFVDGLLAFVANDFAKFFEMRIPCLLCTRIDHVLVRRSPDFYYNDSVCEAHKKEVSSLAYCHVHKKLSDIRKMCEGCLLSFATEKESDCDTYKSLVGILHKDLECFVQDDSGVHLALPAGKKDERVEAKMTGDQRCTCCGEPCKMKPSLHSKNSQKSGKSTSPISQAPAPSPRGPFVTLRNEEAPDLTLPHIRYTELKFNPDTGSDILGHEASSNALLPDNHGTYEMKIASVPLLTESDDIGEAIRTPPFARGNKFFGIPLTDSANSSPRWGSRLLRKSILDKGDFASEPIDSGTVSEDSILTHLKRQVRLDRKSLMAMYMELDEERSASAVAANNAMAMITRLQAEKAAVQMEALQYQRMMEEQAEYDQEALQEISNLLAKREEDIKLLEAELEAYREKHGYLEGFEVRKDKTVDKDCQELKPHTYSFSDGGSECGSHSPSVTEGETVRHIAQDQSILDSLQDEIGTSESPEEKI